MGTLDSLIALSEELPKHDANFTSVLAKIVETLRNLLNNDPSKLAQHISINDKSVDGYLLNHWHWNEGRYGTQRGLKDMTDVLVKARVHNFSSSHIAGCYPTYDHITGDDVNRQHHES
jgi:V-type H+-transporting ATPase subunit C